MLAAQTFREKSLQVMVFLALVTNPRLLGAWKMLNEWKNQKGPDDGVFSEGGEEPRPAPHYRLHSWVAVLQVYR